MKILCVADTELPYLYEYYNPQRTKGVDLIIACGDLKAKYLEFLVTMVNVPLLYVRGNHDTAYQEEPPEGCICIENRIHDFNGLRIMGLGGSMRYNNSPFMYTEGQMRWRIRRMYRRLLIFEGFDILVTHSPARGYGDLDDLPHTGFECFNELLNRWHPSYMLHGHVHKEYGKFERELIHESGTKIINCYGSYTLDLPDDIITERSERNQRWIRRIKQQERLREEY